MLAAPEQRSANQTVILPSKSCQAPAIESWQAGFSHRILGGRLGHRVLAGRLQPSKSWLAPAIESWLAGPSHRILAGRARPSILAGSTIFVRHASYFCMTRPLLSPASLRPHSLRGTCTLARTGRGCKKWKDGKGGGPTCNRCSSQNGRNEAVFVQRSTGAGTVETIDLIHPITGGPYTLEVFNSSSFARSNFYP